MIYPIYSPSVADIGPTVILTRYESSLGLWLWAIVTMNVRYFNHAFVNIDTAPLIVTHAVLSTLCKSLPMNRNAECFHECFFDVVSCQVTFWSMTSLNATHVTLSLYSVLRVQNFVFQTMLILTDVAVSQTNKVKDKDGN